MQDLHGVFLALPFVSYWHRSYDIKAAMSFLQEAGSGLIEMRFYTSLDTEYVILETFFSANTKYSQKNLSQVWLPLTIWGLET